VRRHIGGSVIALALPLAPAAHSAPQTPVFRIDHVTDGDTVVLRKASARLVQIDTPEVFFARECYRRAASRVTERLLPPGARVRLYAEPATHRIDDSGRLLRYVVRVKDGVNVNLAPVAVGAAAPYFYERRQGGVRLSARDPRQERKTEALGLWSACPRTPYDPYRGIDTRR
jgi:endonuclease YncB( thermonuclease family)